MFKAMSSVVGSNTVGGYEPVVVVSNMFVQRMYCEEGGALFSSEWKTIALLASLVERGDPTFCNVSMPVSQWMRLLNIPVCGGRDLLHYLAQIKSLSEKYCHICRVPGECSMHKWLDDSHLRLEENMVSLRLNQDFLPFFSTFVQPYTAVQLSYLMRLSGKYSCDLYIILKSALSCGCWDMRVPVLLRRLGGPQWRSSHLDSRILKPCLQEISEKTDLSVTYTIQRGQRGAAEVVHFFIKRKNKLPRGKRLYGSAGPILIPCLCEDRKKQNILSELYRTYRSELAETRSWLVERNACSLDAPQKRKCSTLP